MPAVREFGRSVLAPLGAPAGTIETFIEVPFYVGERRVYPDGLIRVSRGQRRWTALVEVKTGSNQLEAEQLECYLDVAREQGFNAVITVSNQIPAVAGSHPTVVDKRKLKKVALHHFSWTQLLTEAVMQGCTVASPIPTRPGSSGSSSVISSTPGPARWSSRTWGRPGLASATLWSPGRCGATTRGG